MDSRPQTVAHYAILIGIDDYPHSPLKGCVRDVHLAKTHLESILHDAVQIQMITASQSDGKQPQPATPPAPWPTYDNVVSAFEGTTSQARAGDFVYIHYSGHGTRKPPSGEFSNASSGDVALALLTRTEDSEETQVTYLWGYDLARLLKAMVDKGLVVTLVLDCCFSASVYRHDELEDGGTRFIPYDDEIGLDHPPCPQESPLVNIGSAYRDASALPNWLINPDRYAILAACGPSEVAREPEVDGQRRGLLSFFLLEGIKSLGLTKSHIHIYNYLRAKMRASGLRRQNPWRSGNPNQAFFGRTHQGSSTTRSIPVVMTDNNTLELQAGHAHGVRDSDQFILHALDFAGAGPRPPQQPSTVVSKVTWTRALTSDLELLDPPSTLDQTGWMAHPITQLSLQSFPIRLPSNVPSRDEWVAALRDRSLGVVDTGNTPFAFEVVFDIDAGAYRILGESGEEVIYLPREQTSVSHAADISEHLARYRLARSLVNEAAVDSFTESYRVSIQSSGKEYGPGAEVEVRHATTASLVVKNRGQDVIYVFAYDCGPSWQVENVCWATYNAVMPRNDRERCTGTWTLKLQMMLPNEMKIKGYGSCEDVIKVIITSRPTSFDLLELPRLGGLAKASNPERTDRMGDGPEDWAVVDFHIRTSL